MPEENENQPSIPVELNIEATVESEKPKKKSSTLVIVLLAILACLGIGFGVYAWFFRPTDKLSTTCPEQKECPTCPTCAENELECPKCEKCPDCPVCAENETECPACEKCTENKTECPECEECTKCPESSAHTINVNNGAVGGGRAYTISIENNNAFRIIEKTTGSAVGFESKTISDETYKINGRGADGLANAIRLISKKSESGFSDVTDASLMFSMLEKLTDDQFKQVLEYIAGMN